MEKLMINKIKDAYFEYRENIIKNNYKLNKLKIVIRINPEKFYKLIGETLLHYEKIIIEEKYENEIYYINLLGLRIPILIEDDLPKKIEFIIQSQDDYKKEAYEKILKKFYKMFNEY